jgi:dCMP deaminase
MSDAQKSLPLQPPEPEADPSRISMPREVDNWDEYFLNIAKAVSIKSKDPKCPVGAIIVSQDKIVLSTGFNGLARGVYDDSQILRDCGRETKDHLPCRNAIMNAARVGGRALQGTTIYVTKFPCLACCNAIIQAGITQIYTHDHEFWNDDPFDADHSRKMRVLREAHIEVCAPYHPKFSPREQIAVPKKSPSKKPGPDKASPKRRSAPSIGKVG